MGLHSLPVQERALIRMYPSKRLVAPLQLLPHDIELEDIAHHLGRVCRWGGGVPNFYSVAEHSVAVAGRLSETPELRMWGLMHDAAEAYIGDVCRPLKSKMEVDGYSIDEIEEKILKTIAEKFDLAWPIPQAVWEADDEQLTDEARKIANGTLHGNYGNISSARFIAVFNHLNQQR